jgi:hypothetical protein
MTFVLLYFWPVELVFHVTKDFFCIRSCRICMYICIPWLCLALVCILTLTKSALLCNLAHYEKSA